MQPTTILATNSSLFNPIRPLTLACLFLWFLISILLIAAAGSPTMADGGGTRLGAFQVCNSGGGCDTIDTHCKADGYKIFSDGDCSKLQAIRAFLLMGLFLALAITALTFYMFFAHRMADRALYLAAHALMAVESFFILIAFSVAAALLNDYDVDKGGAFGCLVTAWVLGLVAWGLWAAAAQYETEGVRGLTVGSTGVSSGMPVKTSAGPTAHNTNGTIESVTVVPGAATPYGGQPTYQPAYQQADQQYQPQPQPQQHYSPRQQQAAVVQAAPTVSSQPAETVGRLY